MISVLRTILEGGQSFVLRRRDANLELVLGTVVLLSSAALETERLFGRLAGDAQTTTTSSRVIVGGLGFGSTLRGVLEVALPSAEVVVVEKLKTVIDVAREEARSIVGDALADPRVVLREADVATVIAEAAPKSLSAILLDVDNGPEWASFRTNARLYTDSALLQAKNALAEGGLFAVWSGYPADPFVTRLRRAGFSPRIVPFREKGVVRARAYVGLVNA
jgi:spermidine synthase